MLWGAGEGICLPAAWKESQWVSRLFRPSPPLPLPPPPSSSLPLAILTCAVCVRVPLMPSAVPSPDVFGKGATRVSELSDKQGLLS